MILLISILSTLAFAQEPMAVKQDSKKEHIQISRTDKNIELPKSLVDKIKIDFVEHQKKINPDSTIPITEVLNKMLRRYLSIEVDVWSESDLISRPILFEIPKGGGVIDFQSFIPLTPGKFEMQVKLKNRGEDVSSSKEVKVYFVSNSIQRKIDKEIFGNGCDSYYDVTTFFREKLSSKNSVFFTKDQRYLSFLAGTYVFTLFGADEINIATLSFEDSRFQPLQCRRL